MSASSRVAYEVTADFLELVTPSGHKQWLTAGAQLPEWVDSARTAELAGDGVITGYEEI